MTRNLIISIVTAHEGLHASLHAQLAGSSTGDSFLPQQIFAAHKRRVCADVSFSIVVFILFKDKFCCVIPPFKNSMNPQSFDDTVRFCVHGVHMGILQSNILK